MRRRAFGLRLIGPPAGTAGGPRTVSRNSTFAEALVGTAILAPAAWQLAFILLLGFFALPIAILPRQPAGILAHHVSLPPGMAFAAA